MADFTIGTTNVGVYEIALPAGVSKSIAVAGRNVLYAAELQVTVHDGTAPVYAKVATTVSVQAAGAQMFPPQSFGTITGNGAGATTIALISAAACTVSVART